MTFSRTNLFASIALVVGLALTASCSDNPNSPSNPNAPRIASLSPQTPNASPTAQVVTVTGERFADGLTVLLDDPTGQWTRYDDEAISVQSPTTFTMTVVLDTVGTWDITVDNPDGLESNELRFSVTPAVQ